LCCNSDLRSRGFEKLVSASMKLRCILEQGALHHQDQHQGGQHGSPLPQIEPVLGALCRRAVKEHLSYTIISREANLFAFKKHSASSSLWKLFVYYATCLKSSCM